MSEEDFKSEIRELFDSQRLGVLATDMEGSPYTSLVAFAATEDLKNILFTTLKDTNKFANIQKNPIVNILIDDRKNTPSDIENARAVSVEGKVEVIIDNNEDLLRIYEEKHPYLSKFINDPKNRLCKINVRKYHYVRKFQDVRVLAFKD